MIVMAWVSADGRTVQQVEHSNDRTLSAWWATQPDIVGIMVIFPDGTRHRMEAREFYGIGPSGSTRKRFWSGDDPRDAPAGFVIRPGVLVSDAVYEQASDDMERSH